MSDKFMYQRAVDSLLYLSTRTRPEIAYAVGEVSKYSSEPTTQHWNAVKRIFRYLQGTKTFGLLFKGNGSSNCYGYSDADWGGDRSDRKLSSGYCFYVGDSLISWRSSKQSCVSLSTAEAEYVALASAGQQAAWLIKLINDLTFDTKTLTIFEDNQAAICLANNPKAVRKTKHIDLKYHYVRNLVSDNIVSVSYCPTSEMVADIFTKAISGERFAKLRDMLNVTSIN